MFLISQHCHKKVRTVSSKEICFKNAGFYICLEIIITFPNIKIEFSLPL